MANEAMLLGRITVELLQPGSNQAKPGLSPYGTEGAGSGLVRETQAWTAQPPWSVWSESLARSAGDAERARWSVR